jgi:hypothetical protein
VAGEDGIDLKLPWIPLPGEGPEESLPRLHRGNLLLLAAREALAPDPTRKKSFHFLQALALALQISEESARRIVTIAVLEARQGKLKGSGSVEPRELFRKACTLAKVKGELDEKEHFLLKRFAEALGVPLMITEATLYMRALEVGILDDEGGC